MTQNLWSDMVAGLASGLAGGGGEPIITATDYGWLHKAHKLGLSGAVDDSARVAYARAYEVMVRKDFYGYDRKTVAYHMTWKAPEQAADWGTGWSSEALAKLDAQVKFSGDLENITVTPDKAVGLVSGIGAAAMSMATWGIIAAAAVGGVLLLVVIVSVARK